MKAIDLLNKIASGEEVPKEIRYKDYEYTYNAYTGDYDRYIGTSLFTNLFSKERTNCFINDEVEVIGENKKNNFTGVKYYQDGKEIYVIDNSGNFTCKDGVISDTLRGWFEDDEEDKKIETLDLDWVEVFDFKEQAQQDCVKMVFNKINEIIDKLNKGE